jgi:hypothetical protein
MLIFFKEMKINSCLNVYGAAAIVVAQEVAVLGHVSCAVVGTIDVPQFAPSRKYKGPPRASALQGSSRRTPGLSLPRNLSIDCDGRESNKHES